VRVAARALADDQNLWTDMNWRDRDYNRDDYSGSGGWGWFWSILNGSVPLGTWFGIRVRVHASLIIFIALVLLFDYSRDYPLVDRAISMGFLFAIVLLHEFGHCFAARAVGGFADDILMWPLGGLAMATPPHRPWPTFVTVAGGPMVNVILCATAGTVLWKLTGGIVPLNPFHRFLPREFLLSAHGELVFYIWYLFIVSYMLLLFNLLPIFPLDGGQILQTILWPWFGYYRATSFACITGMIGAGAMGIFGLATWNWLLLFIAINGAFVCYQKRMMLKEMGPAGLQDAVEYSAAHRERSPRASRRAIRRARREAARERAQQQRIDAILEKVSAHGMQSLSWWERRALRRATERQRQRDMQMSRTARRY